MSLDWTTGGLSAGISAGLSAGLNQGYSNSSYGGYSTSANQANAQGASSTDAQAARQWSAEQATLAYNRQKELMRMEMDYNTREAQKAREWNESMANTVYTRSVNNMRQAGINPILAANMGLSGASVGSGQTASIAGNSAPMAQGFMDSSSAWQSQSAGNSESKNSGSSSSESGIVTAIKSLADMASAALGAINAGNTLNVYMNELKDTATKVAQDSNPGAKELDKSGYKDSYKKTGNWLIDSVSKGIVQSINGLQHTTGGGYNAFR